MMPAPLVAAAAPALAQPIIESAVKVLSTDIVKIKGTWYRQVRLKEPVRAPDGSLRFTKTGRVRTHTVLRYDPVEVSGHLNPIGLGILAVGGAIGLGLLVGRIRVGVPGIGEFDLYKGPFADRWDAREMDIGKGKREGTPPPENPWWLPEWFRPPPP